MKKALIIVESPTKIKTLKKILGPAYSFESSIGHIRDLPEKEFGVDVEHDFEPTYVTVPRKEDVIRQLKAAAKLVDIVYLSPDPDREGEAIAWHILEILPKGTPAKRVSFQSITKDAVLNALAHPREIDMALVNAQQARRVLDRLVGYSISPILNRKIHRGKNESVSAGRVQSVALRLVVDREREILAFKPVEYWTLSAHLKTKEDPKPFLATLFSVDGVKIEKEPVEGKDVLIVDTAEKAEQLVKRLDKEPYDVTRVERKEKRRFPPAPFITSTLQQEASRHFGFSSSKTMSIAQSLYEGVDIGNEGQTGLITYMRTDSVRVADEAITEARKWIKEHLGASYLPETARHFATKKSAQDAHEAVRPADLTRSPESLESFLTRDQFRLYQLIWRRFISSQAEAAVYDTLSCDITQKEMIFRATGSALKFAGFLALYEERVDEETEKEEDKRLPPLEEGQRLLLVDLQKEQSFTRPPPRYSEASLVKELEKSGIGRPSTYAAIMNKIQSRSYTEKEQGRLKPTELGCVVSDLLVASFQEIMKTEFTAEMEDALEDVAENKRDWKDLLRIFWKKFEPTLEIAKNEAFVPKVETDIECPRCHTGKLQKVWSKSKYFYGCNRYPDCDYTVPLEEYHFNREEYADNFNWDQKCPKCSKDMKLRFGKFGPFLGCTGYPDCKGIVNIPKKGEVVLNQEDLPDCPAIGCPGKIKARRSRFGKTFYSCSTYPECDVIVNDVEQLEEKYPNHPRTPYVKAEKKWGKKKEEAKKTTSKAKTTTTKAKAVKKTKTTEKEKAKPKREQKPVPISPDLQAFIGKSEAARTEVIKDLWDYIKAHNLQNPKDKRQILPDAKLAALLGKSTPIGIFEIAKLVNPHFI